MQSGLPPPSPPMFTQESAPPPELTNRIIEKIRRHFPQISEVYLREESAVEVRLPINTDVKKNFVDLIDDLREINYLAVVRRTESDLQLIAFQRLEEKARKTSYWPPLLLLASIAIVIIDGYLRTSLDFQGVSMTFSQRIDTSLIYALALIGIIGIHELGHKVASSHHKMRSSWPYFIPGIPVISIAPTFGALITARDPPVNRDSLFDLGISGPIAGLVVAFAIGIITVANTTVASIGAGCTAQSLDFFTSSLGRFFHNISSTQTLCFTPLTALLYLAYSFGFLITFINLFPTWQLDGGHIANAVIRRYSRLLTIASVLIMIIIQFWLMALLIIMLSSRVPPLRPLDDVSPASNGRKAIFVFTIFLAVFLFFGTLNFNGVIQLYQFPLSV
jgi:Zn-dependent protease